MGKLATPQPNKKLGVSLVPITWCCLCKLIIRRSFLKSSSPLCVGLDRSGMVQWVKV